jgi:hypothetical protein
MRIFTAEQGTVAVITPAGAGTVPFVIQVDGSKLDVGLIRGILTAVSMSQDINVQFMHSLNDTIYINVFGNKIGQMTLSGIVFLAKVCESDGAVNSDPPFEKFYKYYLDNNALSKPNALSVQLGTGTTFKAFLLNFTFQLTDAQTSLGQFTMSLAVVPKVN